MEYVAGTGGVDTLDGNTGNLNNIPFPQGRRTGLSPRVTPTGPSLYAILGRPGSTTEGTCKAMKGHARYCHLHVDWVGELATESITLCGGANEDSGTEQTLCPNCAQVRDALNVCGLGPESLRELFDTLRVIDPSEVKAKMEALRDLGVQMDMQDRSQLN